MRTLECHVLETKGFNSEIRISEAGEWEARTRFGWRGIPSPVEQNRRHIEVLRAFVRDQNLSPKRLGLSLPLKFHNWVLISPKCQIRRRGDEWDHVVKMDLFEKRFAERADATGFFDTFSSVSKLVSLETIQSIGRSLVDAHTPAPVNFAAKFGIHDEPTTFIAQAPMQVRCDKCTAPIDARVANFLRRERGAPPRKILCRSCQQSARPAACCAGCGERLDNKVVAFCRFNSQRFGNKLLCRSCQTTGTMAIAAS